MLNELVKKPEATPEGIAALALGNLRAKNDLLVEALQGRMNDHHRFMINQLLEHVTDLDRRIEVFDKRIEALNAPFKSAVGLLDGMPGISLTAANAIISEIGTDMDRFPSKENLSSWAAVCPGNNESGGKRYLGRIRKGNSSLRVILVQAAHVASRMPGTQFYSLYRRIASRRGKKRAIIAVAHAMLAAMYSVLKSGKPYVEPGPDYFKPRDPARHIKRLMQMAEKLGLVLLDPNAAIAA
jgi:transposase